MPKLGFSVPCICESCIEIKIKLILKRPKYAVEGGVNLHALYSCKMGSTCDYFRDF